MSIVFNFFTASRHISVVCLSSVKSAFLPHTFLLTLLSSSTNSMVLSALLPVTNNFVFFLANTLESSRPIPLVAAVIRIFLPSR